MLEDAAEPEAIEEPLTTMEEPMEEIESAVEIETTADAAESIAPEPEQVTESIDESVAPEMPIEPKDSYAEWDCRRFSKYALTASDDINIKIEKTVLGTEVYRERFFFLI